MAHNVEINGTSYIPTQEAAKAVGYTSDYVCKLAREGKIAAKRVGRFWFVDPISLENFYSIVNRERKERNEKLSSIRKLERKRKTIYTPIQTAQKSKIKPQTNAFVGAATIMAFGVFVGVVFYTTVTTPFETNKVRVADMYEKTQTFAEKTYRSLSAIPGSFEFPANIFSAVTEKKLSFEGEAQHTRTGMVVLSSTTPQEEINRIHNSFSDEVHVSFDTPESTGGVITPLFEDRDGEQFRFLLVPVDEKEREGS